MTQISIYYLYIYIQKIPQISKSKQYLTKILLLIVKSNKCYNNIRPIQKNKTF